MSEGSIAIAGITVWSFIIGIVIAYRRPQSVQPISGELYYFSPVWYDNIVLLKHLSDCGVVLGMPGGLILAFSSQLFRCRRSAIGLYAGGGPLLPA